MADKEPFKGLAALGMQNLKILTPEQHRAEHVDNEIERIFKHRMRQEMKWLDEGTPWSEGWDD